MLNKLKRIEDLWEMLNTITSAYNILLETLTLQQTHEVNINGYNYFLELNTENI